MTSGTKRTRTEPITSNVLVNREYQGRSVSFNESWRIWSGGDSPKRVQKTKLRSRVYYDKVVYSRPNRKGVRKRKVIRAFFYAPSINTPKPQKGFRGNNSYSTEYAEMRTPVLENVDTYRGGLYPAAQTVKGSTATWWSAWIGTPSVSLDANDRIKLIEKLETKIQGSTFNAGVFLAEAPQSLKLVTNTAIKLALGISRARKGDLVGALKAISRDEGFAGAVTKQKRADVASNQLAFSYGVVPLFKDMVDGATALAAYLNRPSVKKYHVSVNKKQNASELDQTNQWRFETDFSVHRVKIVAEVQEMDLPSFLGMYDAPSIVWELIPFSFVYDWIHPIGSYLQARAFANKIKGTFITTTHRCRVQHNLQGRVWVASYGDTISTVTPNDSLWKLGSFTREISSSLPVPLPNFVPLSEALSLRRCINALSLLTVAATAPIKDLDLPKARWKRIKF